MLTSFTQVQGKLSMPAADAKAIPSCARLPEEMPSSADLKAIIEGGYSKASSPRQFKVQRNPRNQEEFLQLIRQLDKDDVVVLLGDSSRCLAFCGMSVGKPQEEVLTKQQLCIKAIEEYKFERFPQAYEALALTLSWQASIEVPGLSGKWSRFQLLGEVHRYPNSPSFAASCLHLGSYYSRLSKQKNDPDHKTAAIEYFLEAIMANPRYARAYSYLARELAEGEEISIGAVKYTREQLNQKAAKLISHQ
ncbi:MAG: hypothetical protein ACHQUC_05465 [Chlamydiales bacterium]